MREWILGTYFFGDGFQVGAFHGAGSGIGAVAKGGFRAGGGEVGEDFVVA